MRKSGISWLAEPQPQEERDPGGAPRQRADDGYHRLDDPAERQERTEQDAKWNANQPRTAGSRGEAGRALSK